MLVKEICLYDKKRDRIELDCITEFYFFWEFEDCSVFVVESQILLVPAVSLVCLCVCVCGGSLRHTFCYFSSHSFAVDKFR